MAADDLATVAPWSAGRSQITLPAAASLGQLVSHIMLMVLRSASGRDTVLPLDPTSGDDDLLVVAYDCSTNAISGVQGDWSDSRNCSGLIRPPSTRRPVVTALDVIAGIGPVIGREADHHRAVGIHQRQRTADRRQSCRCARPAARKRSRPRGRPRSRSAPRSSPGRPPPLPHRKRRGQQHSHHERSPPWQGLPAHAGAYPDRRSS